jgi:cytochrome c553
MQHLITLCHEYKKDACTPLTRLLLASCTPHTRLILCHEYKERRVHTSYTPLTRLLHASYTPLTLSRIQRKTRAHLLHASYSPLTRLILCHEYKERRVHTSYTPLTRLLHASYTPHTLSRIQRKTSTHAHMHDMSIHAHTSATTTAHQSPTPCITPLNKRRQRIHRQRPATCPLTRLLHASYTPHLPLALKTQTTGPGISADAMLQPPSPFPAELVP